MVEELSTPILSGGIRHPNYFNGRVLTADALQREQEAVRHLLGALGRGVGEGVVHGLEVEAGGVRNGRPFVRVRPGLALNRRGHVLSFQPDGEYVEVSLVRSHGAPPTGPGLFAECVPTEPDVVPTGTDVYVFTVMPASGFEERTPGVDIDTGRTGECGSRYLTRGVQFRLVRLSISSAGTGSIGAALLELMGASGGTENTRFRNLLAHYCLGTAERSARYADLYRTVTAASDTDTYGALDALRASGRLTSCDVPLALIFWTSAGLSFIDLWPVRRSIHRILNRQRGPEPATGRARAEREAAQLQFQHHLDRIVTTRTNAQLQNAEARTFFRFVPAAGVVPLAEGGFTGMTPSAFFRDLTVRGPYFIEAAEVPSLFDETLNYEPLDLDTGVFLWTYLVRENRQFPAGRRPFLIFTAGYVPFRAEAQYDLARWNFSHYSPGVASQPAVAWQHIPE